MAYFHQPESGQHHRSKISSFRWTLFAWGLTLVATAILVFVLTEWRFPFEWHSSICLGPLAIVASPLINKTPVSEFMFYCICYGLLLIVTHVFSRLRLSWLWLASWVIVGIVATWMQIVANFVT
jgi:hypothetical protein